MDKDKRIRELEAEIRSIKATQERYVVERRTPDGKLVFVGPRPPFTEASVDQLFDPWFKEHPEANTGPSLDGLRKWYAERGWGFRLKTWG